MVPPLNGEGSASARGLWGSNVTLFGHDNCSGVPSPRRHLTGTDSKPIQSYHRVQGNLLLITIVVDAEIAVQGNQSCWDSHSFLRLHMNFLFLQCWFGEYLQYSPIPLLTRQHFGFDLEFHDASVCQGLSIHLSKGSTHPWCSHAQWIWWDYSWLRGSASVQGLCGPVPTGQCNSISAGKIYELNTTAWTTNITCKAWGWPLCIHPSAAQRLYAAEYASALWMLGSYMLPHFNLSSDHPFCPHPVYL